VKLDLALTAVYVPGVIGEPGEVQVRVNGITMLKLQPRRAPGGEPEAERNVIIETIADISDHLQATVDRKYDVRRRINGQEG
jgi:hypothetical protein